MGRQMTKALALMAGLFLLACVGFLFFMEKSFREPEHGENLVLLSEIETLTAQTDGNPAQAEIDALKASLETGTGRAWERYARYVALGCGALALLYAVLLFCYLYRNILSPFTKLEAFAGELAKGNFEVALPYERTNFFGAFTWAFDHMRKELVRARQNEADAIRENKTIIATLSHDIKTPIASIRAYTEGLEAGLEADYETRQRYMAVILKKCDEVTRLTDDLMLHSLSELERIEIVPEEIQIKPVLEELFGDLDCRELTLQKPIPDAVLVLDKKRLVQVLGNLIDNAKKYAPGSEIRVWAKRQEGAYEIHVRDFGDGIAPADMPFLFDRFYRGKNAADAPGSGLGLYIVHELVSRMDGEVELRNHADGLEAIVRFFIS